MIITISGRPGSGKSTVARIVSERLGFRHYSVGDFQRKRAAELKLSLADYGELCERNRSYDLEADGWQKKLGEKEDNFVIDARIGFHFIPNSKKVFLDVDAKEAAKRVFNDRKRLQEARSVEEEMALSEQRQNSEINRYEKYYGVNPYKKENYDLVIDTTHLSVKEVVDKIISFAK